MPEQDPNSVTARRVRAVQQVRADLELRRQVSDHIFDQIYEPAAHRLSAVHWTPAFVATEIAMQLVTRKDCTVLDVGSGAGKFCVLGALTTPGSFVGVERRSWLVEAATDLAAALGAERTTFLCGDALDIDWREFD